MNGERAEPGSWPALAVRGLRFTFPRATRPALDRVSLRVEAGRCTGLLGQNGAGKTTFVSLVCGLLVPDRGELYVFGHPSGTRAARRAIGFCPQELALFPTLSVRENLRVFGRLSGLGGPQLAARVEACLRAARLGAEAHARVERLSGGMKRRLNLAVALLHEPRLLVLDEPTAGVDVQSRRAIFETLSELARQGTTILYTTHYMEEVERLCDEVVVIDRGRVLAAGPVATLGGRDVQRFHLTLHAGREPAELAREAEQGGLVARVVGTRELELAGEDLAVLTALVARLSARGDLLSCETRRATLEERFLALTGDEPRE